MTKDDTINIWDIWEAKDEDRNRKITEFMSPIKEEILDGAWEELMNSQDADSPVRSFPVEKRRFFMADYAEEATMEFLTSLHVLQKHGLMGDMTRRMFVRCLIDLTASQALYKAHESHKAAKRAASGIDVNIIGIDASDIPPELLEILKKLTGKGS